MSEDNEQNFSKDNTVDALELFKPEAADALRSIIKNAHGVEVYCLGITDNEQKVVEIEHYATGNKTSVPAPGQNAAPGQVLIHNHPSGYLEPSDSDINVAAMYGVSGVGSYIVNNDVSKVRVVVKLFKAREIVKLDLEALSGILVEQEDGPLAIEHRPEQLDMLKFVATAMNERQIAVIEAGTGIGKSFAYLIPAIDWALKNKGKMIISTSTITLQEQLLDKDIPELKQMMNVGFKTQLLKGRSHFICKRRLEMTKFQPDLFPTQRMNELRQVMEWAESSQTGDRDEIKYKIDNDIWDEIQCDSFECLSTKCKNFDNCFYYNMHRAAAAADFVIVNHSLLMSDLILRLFWRIPILPAYNCLIIDEAHNIEPIASEHFTVRINMFELRRLKNRLYQNNGKGLLKSICDLVRHSDPKILRTDTEQLLNILETELVELCGNLDSSINEVFDNVMADVITQSETSNDSGSNGYVKLRVDQSLIETQFWQDVTEMMEALLSVLIELLKKLQLAYDRLEDYNSEEIHSEQLINYLVSFKSITKKFGAVIDTLSSFMTPNFKVDCPWFEVKKSRSSRKAKQYLEICKAALDVSPFLRRGLFGGDDTVVMTSATLTVNKNFDYFDKQVGLCEPNYSNVPEDEVIDLKILAAQIEKRRQYAMFGSPFNYEDNCRLMIPTDIEEPDFSDQNFNDDVLDKVVFDAIEVTNGRAMLLFTSYRAMHRFYDKLSDKLKSIGIDPYMQGEQQRMELLKSFRRSKSAVLFATMGYWEGIDLKGDALVLLFLHHLPFAVPIEPLAKAKSDALKDAGGNPFMELSLPAAVIKLKQGFGRLIRSKSDYGTVFVLDKRIITKRYGKTFLNSLPAKPTYGDCDSLIRQLREFYNDHESQ